MTRANDIASLVDSTGDIVAAALDNVPPSNDASALTTGTLDMARVANGSVTASHIANDTITATQIAADTITATQIADDTITGTQIAADTIGSSELGADSVTSDQIADDAVNSAQIVSGAVTSGKLASGAADANLSTTNNWRNVGNFSSSNGSATSDISSTSFRKTGAFVVSRPGYSSAGFCIYTASSVGTYQFASSYAAALYRRSATDNNVNNWSS